jgi:hypothetical protein
MAVKIKPGMWFRLRNTNIKFRVTKVHPKQSWMGNSRVVAVSGWRYIGNRHHHFHTRAFGSKYEEYNEYFTQRIWKYIKG